MRQAFVAILVIAVSSGFAVADLTYTIAPGDLANGAQFANGAGGEPFGYDPDQPPPIGASVAGPAGYGPNCFWADVQGSAVGGGRDYTSLRLSPNDIFPSYDYSTNPMTLADLEGISYWSKAFSTVDWQIKIYTKPTTTGWYGHRFNFDRGMLADGEWHQWGSQNLDVNWIRGSGDNIYPSGMNLSDLYADYGSEEIMFIDIIASYMTTSPAVDSYLDGVRLTAGGVTADIDLVPSPGAAVLGILGMGFVGMLRRRVS